MKVYNKKKLIASNVRDCKGLMNAVGLRFKKGFNPYDAYLIHMLFDSILDSFFVGFEFLAVWLSRDNKVLKIQKCRKNRLFPPVKDQFLVLELPVASFNKIKKSDVLAFKP